MASHNELGKEGELRAKAFLEEKGYEILDINWRYKNAEIDIVALFDDKLIIVEVKTRTSLEFGLPQEFVNNKKIRKLLEATNAYIENFNRQEEVRFDIVSIYKKKTTWQIEHIEDAFYYF